MIWAEALDAGTRPLVQRAARPGMDRLTYTEIDYEEDYLGQRTAAVNDQMRAVPEVELAPWPEKLPGFMPLDYVDRHAGLSWQLHEANQQSSSQPWAPVPGGSATVLDSANTLDPGNRDMTNVSRLATPAEVQAAATQPTKWLRLPFVNEEGGTQLGAPLVLNWRGLQASRFTLALSDNDVFTPFDLTKLDERYLIKDDEGKNFDHSEFFAAFGDRSRLRLYLRPRRWRIFAHVWAHYEYISAFESVLNDEQFVKVYYDRPPVYPIRHDVRHTAGQQAMWHEYEGGWLAYDYGIDWQFSHSRAAADLRSQIVEQEWYSLCVAYVLIGVEAAKLTISRVSPAVGELVLGIGRIDQGTGIESRVWIMQKTDVSAAYPQTQIGIFYSDFF